MLGPCMKSTRVMTMACKRLTTQPLLQVRHFYGQPEPERLDNEFDRQWRKWTKQEKDKVREEYAQLEKGDWKQLTMEQKRALYTIAYGLPELKDPNFNATVLIGTILIVSAAFGVISLHKYINGTSPTWTDDAEKQRVAYLKAKAKGIIADEPLN